MGRMFGRLLFLVLVTLIPPGLSLQAIDLEDCLKLKSYYLETDSVVERKITEIDQQIRQDPGDAFLYLAKTTLLTIMASNSVKADPQLADRMLANLAIFQGMQPANAFGVIYKGAALGYKAKTSPNLFDQLSLIGEAIANFDHGLNQLSGTNYEWWARSMRGSSYAQFPLALGKREIAMADLAYVENAFAQDPALIGEAVVAFYYLGELNASLGKQELAISYWKRAARLNQGSPLSEGRKAEQRLKRFK